MSAPDAQTMMQLPLYGHTNRFHVGVTIHFFSWLKIHMQQKNQDIPPSLTTDQLVCGKFSRGAAGPSPLEWCIMGETESSKSRL